MEKKLNGVFWCVGVLGLVTVVLTVHAITCEEAVQTLMPCKAYLTTPAPSPTLACCQAVASVNASASTTQSRRDLCECFKKKAPVYGIDPQKAKQLPGLCAVQVPFPCDPSVDCQHILQALAMELQGIPPPKNKHKSKHQQLQKGIH